MRTYIFDDFYYGMKVISVAEDGPSVGRPLIPRKGVIGTLMDHDSWDNTFRITSQDPFYPLRTESQTVDCWFRTEYWEPYRPDPEKTEDGHRIDDFTHEIIFDDSEILTWVDETGWVRESTLRQFFSICEDCGRIYKNDEILTVNGRKVCESCLERNDRYYQCPDCGRWFDMRVEGCIHTYEGRVCMDCAEQYQLCPECNEWAKIAEFETVAGDDRALCRRCANRLKRKCIHQYSYKPAPKFKVGHKSDQYLTDENITDLLMGVELEIDKGDDDASVANEIVQNCPDVYCKHDGSLSCGVEIVTHPCTLKYHLEELGWDKIVEIAKKHNFKSHNAKTCGLHVHVGRRQLGDNDAERDNTAAKMVLAMQRHWDNMVKFSRRLESQLNWCECNNVDLDFVEDEASLLNAALDTEDEGRYQAVNLTNEYTVEIRIFRGTLELNTIKATLEFVSNLCLYCKNHTALEVMNSQWEDIAYYEAYGELFDYLRERDLGNGQIGMFATLPSWEFPTPIPTTIRDEDVEETYDVNFPILRDDRILDRNSRLRMNDFHPGEYVLVCNRGGRLDEAAPVGRVGRVITARGDSCGVRFSGLFRNSHNLHGEIEDRTGYYIRPGHLVHYESSVRPDIEMGRVELEEPTITTTTTATTATFTIDWPNTTVTATTF